MIRAKKSEEELPTICRGPAGFFEAPPRTPIPPTSLYLQQIQATDYGYCCGIFEIPQSIDNVSISVKIGIFWIAGFWHK